MLVTTFLGIWFSMEILPCSALRCYTGLTYKSKQLVPLVGQQNCSMYSDLCRVTTLTYTTDNIYGFSSHTNYICDKHRFPCDMWCSIQMSIDRTIDECETFCCDTDHCNHPGIYDSGNNEAASGYGAINNNGYKSTNKDTHYNGDNDQDDNDGGDDGDDGDSYTDIEPLTDEYYSNVLAHYNSSKKVSTDAILFVLFLLSVFLLR